MNAIAATRIRVAIRLPPVWMRSPSGDRRGRRRGAECLTTVDVRREGGARPRHSPPAAATPPESRPEPALPEAHRDRKSTRLNSSHVKISYAVFCLKKIRTYITIH